MNRITQTIENAIYAYDPTEYMPIFEDGELANRSAFIAYKLRRAGQHIASGADRLIEATQLAIDQ